MLLGLIFLLGIGTTSFSQELRMPDNNGVQLLVDVTTEKNSYQVGEPIRFRAILVNSGHSGIYVAKSFGYAGGGTAGFYLSVKQRTGKTPQEGCAAYGDRFPVEEHRSPEQILHEDYVLLSPGELIGFESTYTGCEAKYPGTYQIQALYSAQDWNLQRVLPLNEKGIIVLKGQISSRPFTFHIRSRK